MGALKEHSVQLLALLAVAALSHLVTKHSLQKEGTHLKIHQGRITGVGGIFFKTPNPAALRDWYKMHLGLNTNQYGTVFEFGNLSDSTANAHLQWSPFSAKTTFFENEFMINYRVNDLELLLSQLRKNGVEVLDSLAVYDYGKFVHIRDLDGNKVELWEPVDKVFATYTEGAVTK